MVEELSPRTADGRLWRIGRTARDSLLVILGAFAIRTFLVEPKLVSTDSMVPTIQVGDRVLVEKVTYRLRAPARGEIITFDPPFPSRYDHVKRVVAVAGDTVQIDGGCLYVNGAALNEPYVTTPPAYEFGPVTIPEGKLFVLGDNRNNSLDSHVWGFLDTSAVHGRVVLCFWPPARAGRLDHSKGGQPGDTAPGQNACTSQLRTWNP